MRVTVDDDACGGHGICVGLCPQVFALTDVGNAEAITADVPAELEDDVSEAAASCPEHAIRVLRTSLICER
jgi:ferredoxin